MHDHIVMLGTSHDTRRPGGIRSVIEIYLGSGLFDKWPIIYLGTHEWGSHFTKTRIASRALWEFQKSLAKGKVGLVHAHTSVGASFWRKSLFFLSAFAWKCPVILHLHGGKFEDFYYNRCGPARRRFIRYIFDNVDTIIVLSDGWKEVIGRITRNQNIVSINNPIAFDREKPEDRSERAPAFLFLGRLEESKGVNELFDAFSIVKREFGDAQLWCGGYIAKDLEERVNLAAEDESVRILGWLQGEEKERVLREAMVFVLPSWWEGMPISILEAMAVGLPIVASDVGGIPDVVTDGTEGLLVKPRDAQGLAEAMASLLRDDEARERMGRDARQKIDRQYSSDRILPQIEAIYRSFGIHPVANGGANAEAGGAGGRAGESTRNVSGGREKP